MGGREFLVILARDEAAAGSKASASGGPGRGAAATSVGSSGSTPALEASGAAAVPPSAHTRTMRSLPPEATMEPSPDTAMANTSSK